MSDRVHLLILGEQRSGTTLLAALLAEQPGVRVLIGYLAAPFERARAIGLDPRCHLTEYDRQVLLGGLRQERRARGIQQTRIGIGDFSTFGEFYRLALDEVAEAGAQLVGHKLHELPASIETVLAEMPSLRIVMLVRDARDVALSRSYRGETDIDRFLSSWVRAVREGSAARAHCRLLLLRFEDLVLNLHKTVRSLETFLGIPIHTSFDSFSSPTTQWRENSSFDDVRELFDASAVSRWKARRDDPCVRYAGWVCRNELELTGYAPGPRISGAERVRFVRRQTALSLLHGVARGRAMVRRVLVPPMRR